MTFSPPRSAITGITQANPCVITTSANHNLTTGQIVRVHVPKPFGMTPLNQNTYSVTVLSPTTISLQISQVPVAINVNSINFPAFVSVAQPQFTAEILAVGSGPTLENSTPPQMTNNSCVSKTEDATTNIAITNQPF